MAADLYRVVRTRPGTDGVMRTIASEAISREIAMGRWADCVTLGMDRVRVIREQDYRPVAAPVAVDLDRHILGCARRFPRGARCPLPAGHDGACVPIGAGS